MLLLDERIRADGSHARTWAEAADAGAAIIIIGDDDEAGGTGRLPARAVDRVMCRYGRPLEAGAVLDGDALALAGGYQLRRYRFHAIVDATARDYLVWERPDGEPLAAIATMVTAALRFLLQPPAATGAG